MPKSRKNVRPYNAYERKFAQKRKFRIRQAKKAYPGRSNEAGLYGAFYQGPTPGQQSQLQREFMAEVGKKLAKKKKPKGKR